jgi:tetratricopeptide (TPR) repeat protein
MVSFDARPTFGTITRIVGTLVILLAPFSAPAQTAGAPAPVACPQSVQPDSGSSPRTMDRSVGRALDRAMRAINAKGYADARASVGELDFDQLTPYELAMAEGVLFRIANAEREYGDARQHLVRSIESCGLTVQGIADAQEAIKRIDADLATVALAVVDPPSATVAQPDSPAAAEDALQALVVEIDQIQTLGGGNSADLIEPLTALSLLYEERGNYELALGLIDETIRIIEVNYGLYTLDEAQLLRQSIRIERARGNTEAAWNEEQELLRVIRRHRYDARTIPMLQEIADGRRAILARYQAGEFPPEIVLGCYYSTVEYDNGLPRRTGCSSGNRGTLIRALRGEAAGYELQARRLAGWAEAPCVRPEWHAIGSERLSKRRAEEVHAIDYLFAVMDYTQCTDAKYRLAASANASAEELLQLASDRTTAVEELAAQAAIYEERFGFLPKLVDAVLPWLRRPPDG